MVYLYAGLGVAMLTGIMAIFEMGLALTGNSLLPSPQDPYLSNKALQDEDKQWLRLLADDAVIDQLRGKFNSSLCDQLKAVYSERLGLGDVSLSPWRIDADRMSVTQGDWVGSCIMNEDGHRVIVRPPDPSAVDSTFNLFSCVLQGSSDRCPFEQG